MSLLCPKCTDTMRQYERNEVIIDQCVGCGGIFLDRGELERLAQAEANYYSPQTAQPLPARPVYRVDERQEAPRSRDYHDDDDRRYDTHGSGKRKSPKRRRRESFFSELLDILD